MQQGRSFERCYSGCREIKAKLDAEGAAVQMVKDKAKQMATALQTLGVIKIAKKVCGMVTCTRDAVDSVNFAISMPDWH